MSVDMEFRKEKGLNHLSAAFGYSLGGASRLWKETAFRHEILGFFGLSAFYAVIRPELSVVIAAAILFLVLVATEALNTAIEELVDRISPEISATGRHAKDLGSLAVFCLLVANGLLAAYALTMRLAG
jgi:diacylglycerol kinase (ATP)